MLLPWALHKHWITGWVSLTLILIIAGGVWPSILRLISRSANKIEELSNKVQNIPQPDKDLSALVELSIPYPGIDEEPARPSSNPGIGISVGAVEGENIPEVAVAMEEENIPENTGAAEDVNIPVNPAGIEEMIDLGFTAKYAGNYEQAAWWFSQALGRDPDPDLAFSLLSDIFWLWQAVKGKNYASNQIALLIIRINLPQEVIHKFNAWQ